MDPAIDGAISMKSDTKTMSYNDAFEICFIIAAFAIGLVAAFATGSWTFFGPIGLIIGTIVGMIPATIAIFLFFPITMPIIALAAWGLKWKSERDYHYHSTRNGITRSTPSRD